MSELNISNEEGIACITINRPKVLNALSPDLLNSLINTCNTLRLDDNLKTVILRGSGENFSSGADLPAFQTDLTRDPQTTADLGRLAAEALSSLPQITMAAIQGYCVGGAIVLAAACDIRVASENSHFFIPEIDAGIPLAWGGMDHLVRLVGATLAADLVVTCRKFGADEALQSGFTSRIIKTENFEKEISKISKNISQKSNLALKITKQQLISIRNGNFDSRNDAASMLNSIADPEGKNIHNKYVNKLK